MRRKEVEKMENGKENIEEWEEAEACAGAAGAGGGAGVSPSARPECHHGPRR